MAIVCPAHSRSPNHGMILFAILASLLFVGSVSSLPQEVRRVFPDADASIYSAAYESASAGGFPHIFSGALLREASVRRALLRFDVRPEAIGENFTIVEASVALTMNQKPPAEGAVNFTLFKLTEPWSEGDASGSGPGGKGFSSSPGDVTWIYSSFNNVSWPTPGGDFLPSNGTTAEVSGQENAETLFQSQFVLQDVLAWQADAASNHGYILVGDETVFSASARRFYSREDSTESRRPALVLTLQGPSTFGACCQSSTSDECRITELGNCTGTYLGQNTSCLPNQCSPSDGDGDGDGDGAESSTSNNEDGDGDGSPKRPMGIFSIF